MHSIGHSLLVFIFNYSNWPLHCTNSMLKNSEFKKIEAQLGLKQNYKSLAKFLSGNWSEPFTKTKSSLNMPLIMNLLAQKKKSATLFFRFCSALNRICYEGETWERFLIESTLLAYNSHHIFPNALISINRSSKATWNKYSTSRSMQWSNLRYNTSYG